MFRKLTITVTAAAMALTSFAATPARADDDDVAKALAALVGIAIVGKIIHDEKKKKKAQRRIHPVKPRPLPRRVDRLYIPPRCFREFETPDGWVSMYGRRCLERHFDYAHELPRDCKRRVHTYRGKRVGYKARCLRRWGYKVAMH